MWAKSGFLFASRMVFLGETPETDSAICFDNSDLRRLLHHRLEVLEAALLELARLQPEQPKAHLWSSPLRTELTFTYDAALHPIAGKCSACGEPMPTPPRDPHDSVDTILWLSHHFIVHKTLKHTTSAGADNADDLPQ